jgi:RNA polymerase sigma-70 factor (ECF subfamily)
VSATEERDSLERQIRELSVAGDKKQAVTLLLKGYGRELFGFLVSRLRDRDAASEVFSAFTEDVWRGLDGFRWQCSARVWAYTLARHAASHYIHDARRRGARHVPLSRAGEVSEIVERIRTETLASARTEAKTQIAKLRQRLPEEDQTLLVLRVNRRLTWPEIAMVLLHDGEVVDDATLAREAVRLRQRFQTAKDKLRKMAEKEGLIRARGGDEG